MQLMLDEDAPRKVTHMMYVCGIITWKMLRSPFIHQMFDCGMTAAESL